jgi:hypothetical protein
MPTKPKAPAADATTRLLEQLARSDRPAVRRWAELLLAGDGPPRALPGRERTPTPTEEALRHG